MCGDECNCKILIDPSMFGDGQHYFMGRDGYPIFNPTNTIMNFVEDYFPYAHYFAAVHDSWVDRLLQWGIPDLLINVPTMPFAYLFAFFETNYDKFMDFMAFLDSSLKDTGSGPIELPWCKCE